ncbi:phosphoglycerate mutase [Gymnopilus junonius]|uniref:Phosphoglycerate mutase n=1 Tax=Gymnopilus junonius TaxID=109634 RepID=A0A9P5NJM4_GYMJU|nr:phosphoglycerate mutase [Gymnopilus junonius]
MATTTYEYVPGNFAHDDEEQSPLAAVPHRFGLKDESKDRWTILFQQLSDLNNGSPHNVSYKFFLLSRHGQGYHNLAESKYGTDAWDDHWSKLNGDGEIIWGPDPLLTPLGKDQAEAIGREWAKEAAAGLPPPHRRYCSPLSRALDTCDIMFDGAFEDHSHAVLIVENCREENGVHTCDQRNLRSYIAKHKPHFEFEEAFTEFDELWSPNIRETKAELTLRARGVIERIFETNPEATFISITAHGGFITGFLKAIGRKLYTVPTGGVIPVIVRAVISPAHDFL